ncbi:DUF1127 domain-containing protein [Azorhizobium doebereinerae]|uniref:DUF1127 domain-containing protein n=1 Tax=Azorhizobium doebereinerae TaxID=281091 RepID=UPI0003FF2687|nr:DUF1127 domain-containing protein [Azorhizobium doebereinerae]
MASLGEISSTFAEPFGTRVATTARLVVRAVRHITEAIARRNELTVLGAMNDAMLRDIGIDRADLRDAASVPWWSDPTQVLVSRSVERQASRKLQQRLAARQRMAP